MKNKKLNLILPLCLCAPCLSSISTALTSCSSENHIEAAEQTAYLIGEREVAYLTFTLDHVLKPNEGLEVEIDDKGTQFLFDDLIISSKLVSIPVYFAAEKRPPQTKRWSGDVTFKCKNLKKDEVE